MKRNYVVFLVLLLFSVQPAMADDTDIYGISAIDVKANVLVIFDNSGSMNTADVPGDVYDPGTTYPAAGYVTERLYYSTSQSSYSPDWVARNDNDPSHWQCGIARTSLETNGYWQGKFNRSGDIVNCENITTYSYRTGNYLNFLNSPSGGDQVRMIVAKRVVANLINDDFTQVDGEWVSSVNWGIMKFNPYNSSYSSYDNKHDGGYIVQPCGSSKNSLIGSFTAANSSDILDSDQSATFGAVGSMWSETYTPLAETLTEAGHYFAGVRSLWNGTTPAPMGIFDKKCSGLPTDSDCYDYSFTATDTFDQNSMTPIQYRCQKNYVIVITDGNPTRDSSPRLNGNKMADVSKYLFDTDLRPSTSGSEIAVGKQGDFEVQNIVTHTIGFATDLPFLEEVAINGGGKYYAANNISTLQEALQSILSNIKASNEGFSAAAVPVSQANKAYAGNFVYYGLFQPTASTNWVGNLKKYGISNMGIIMDNSTPPKPATSGGVLLPDAKSYWSTEVDGPKVLKGGAGAKLQAAIDAGISRTIYTYTNGGSKQLKSTENLFTTTNSHLTDGTYSGLTESVIEVVRAENAESGWPYGSFLHSQPLVVHYSDTKSMIFAGANDGMLHCIDDTDGSEEWSFIPHDLLSNLSNLKGASTLQHFVDGTPILYQYDHDSDPDTQDKKMIIFGERRGGYNYTALDVSTYDDPQFSYEVNASIAGSESLGQSWSVPQSVQMVTAESEYICADGKCEVDKDHPTQTKDVFLISGGYDENQDNETPGDDTKGRAVLAFGSQDGTLLSAFNFNHSNFASMTHSIIAASAFENPKTRNTTRVYAGDLGGNLFAFRDDIYHRNRSIADREKFSDLYDGLEDGSWGQKLKLFSSPGKKIFYPPNIVNEYVPVSFYYLAGELGEASEAETRIEKRVGDFVYYGTGDRAHPEKTSTTNSFYAIKNNWQWSSTEPTIVEAYVDKDDAYKIKKISDDSDIGSSLFILDITDNLYQDGGDDGKKFVDEAMYHENNRGWFLDFEELDGSSVGEKIVATPIIFAGVVYFTTYIPAVDSTGSIDDPCANSGAKGSGYFYALGYQHGNATLNFTEEEGDPEIINRKDRRKKLNVPGIPPAPVLVVHEGKPTIIAGFETIDPVFTQSVENFYWRQINRP